MTCSKARPRGQKPPPTTKLTSTGARPGDNSTFHFPPTGAAGCLAKGSTPGFGSFREKIRWEDGWSFLDVWDVCLLLTKKNRGYEEVWENPWVLVLRTDFTHNLQYLSYILYCMFIVVPWGSAEGVDALTWEQLVIEQRSKLLWHSMKSWLVS